MDSTAARMSEENKLELKGTARKSSRPWGALEHFPFRGGSVRTTEHRGVLQDLSSS